MVTDLQKVDALLSRLFPTSDRPPYYIIVVEPLGPSQQQQPQSDPSPQLYKAPPPSE